MDPSIVASYEDIIGKELYNPTHHGPSTTRTARSALRGLTGMDARTPTPVLGIALGAADEIYGAVSLGRGVGPVTGTDGSAPAFGSTATAGAERCCAR
jgi:hypothetical protein